MNICNTLIYFKNKGEDVIVRQLLCRKAINSEIRLELINLVKIQNNTFVNSYDYKFQGCYVDKLYIYGGRLVDGILMEEDDQPWHSVHRKIHNISADIKMKKYKIETSFVSPERS